MLTHFLLLQITAPFLHIGGVIVATLASWLVARWSMRQRASNSKPSKSKCDLAWKLLCKTALHVY